MLDRFKDFRYANEFYILTGLTLSGAEASSLAARKIGVLIQEQHDQKLAACCRISFGTVGRTDAEVIATAERDGHLVKA